MMSVRDGAISDLATLFERHNKMLFGYYVRLTGDREMSEDFVQEVFLRIMKYRHTFRGESKFTTWMYTIARNVQMDNIRRWYREQAVTTNTNDETPEAVSGEPVDHLYDTGILREAILRLSPEKREALLLNRFEGMKYREIAGTVGCSIENVKIRIHRAVRDLRKIYTEMSGETAQ